MLPRPVYNKVLASLKFIKKQWDEDREENPSSVPYDIDSSLRMAIERHMREGHVRYHGSSHREQLIDGTVDYLREKGLIVRSPYGGHMFPLPDDHDPLPSKDELVEDIKKRLDL